MTALLEKKPNKNVNKRLWILFLSALVLVVGGYFALVLYASEKVQKELQKWVYENDLEDQVQWSSVRSSPFFGRIKINDLQIKAKKSFLLDAQKINIEQLKINGFRSTDKRFRADLFFMNIHFLDEQGKADLPFKWLYESGRKKLEQFDFHVDFDLDASHLDLAVDAQLADNFQFDLQFQFDEVPNPVELKKLFKPKQKKPVPLPASGVLQFGDLMQAMEKITLLGFTSRFEDEGYFKRRNILLQRHEYASAINPASDDIAEQRKKVHLQFKQKNIQACGKGIAGKLSYGKKLCDVWAALQSAEIEGLLIRAKPKNPVQVGKAFSALLMEQARPELEALNVEAEAL